MKYLLIYLCVLLFHVLTAQKNSPKKIVKKLENKQESVTSTVKGIYKELFEGNRETTVLPTKAEKDTANSVPRKHHLGRIRLVNAQNTLHEGRVEYLIKDKWRPVCADSWNAEIAKIACQEAGFTLGAEEFYQSHKYGEVEGIKNTDYAFKTLYCSGQETRLRNCTFNEDRPCVKKSAGVKCLRHGGCPPGWFHYQRSCYKYNDKPTEFKEAMTECKKLGAELLRPNNKREEAFLSKNLVIKGDPSAVWIGVTLVETDAAAFKWGWAGERAFIKDRMPSGGFWPPFLTKKFLNPKEPCVSMSRYYKETGKWFKSDEYWWNNMGCATKLGFICEKILQGSSKSAANGMTNTRINGKNSRECYDDNGSSYRGSISRTKNNFVCASWDDPTVAYAPLYQLSYGLSGNNHCRNPDGDKQPWCWVNTEKFIYDYCDIPKCSDLPDMSPIKPATVDLDKVGFNKGNCEPGFFYCPKSGKITYDQCLGKSLVCDGFSDCGNGEDESGKFCGGESCSPQNVYNSYDKYCLDKSKVCDGFTDFSDGSDERNCPLDPAIKNEFKETKGKLCSAYPRIQVPNIKLEKCLWMCKTMFTVFDYNFICMGANFISTGKSTECQLYPKKPSECGSTADKDSITYEIDTKCTNKFACKNKRCIDSSLKCNGVNNCGDGSDELGCPGLKDNYKLRLFNTTSDPSKGRLEVHYLGDWGQICSSGFSVSSANVACRELGFKGAISFKTVSQANIPHGNNRPMLSNVNCKGTEKTLKECPKDDFYKSDCDQSSFVFLDCQTDRECLSSEFKCKNGKCIDNGNVCNKVNNCGDNSDEVGDCSVKVSLESGTNKSGRVVVSRGGVKGTICKDLFDEKDAQVVCKMLNIPGIAKVLPSSKYGPGFGPILYSDLICNGKEDSIEKCSSKGYGAHTCSHLDDVAVECGGSPETTTTTAKPSVAPKPKVECGTRMNNQWGSAQRVVGGFRAEKNAFPWQVRIAYYTGSQYCGGTIINEKWILSAAHCFYDNSNAKQLLRIIVGDLDVAKADPEEQIFTIKSIHIHPEYNTPQSLNNDFAMVRINPSTTNKYIEYGDSVRPMCLAKDNEYPKGRCIVSGWGTTSEGGSVASLLQAALIPYIPKEECSKYMSDITDQKLCGGYAGGQIDSCQGDSGGPLVCESGPKLQLYGVVSYGVGCARPGYPGIYSRPNTVRSWIEKTMSYDP